MSFVGSSSTSIYVQNKSNRLILFFGFCGPKHKIQTIRSRWMVEHAYRVKA